MWPIKLTISDDLERPCGHSPIVIVFKFDSSNIYATTEKISTHSASRGPCAVVELLLKTPNMLFGNWTTGEYANSQIAKTRTRQLLMVIRTLVLDYCQIEVTCTGARHAVNLV